MPGQEAARRCLFPILKAQSITMRADDNVQWRIDAPGVGDDRAHGEGVRDGGH
jgi:hypothetical protein